MISSYNKKLEFNENLAAYIDTAKKYGDSYILNDDAFAYDIVRECSKTFEFDRFEWLGREAIVLVVDDKSLSNATHKAKRILKIARPELLQTARDRFVRSAVLLDQIRSPFFPQIKWRSDNPLYLLLDYTQGKTYRQWRKSPTFSPRENIERFRKTLNAIEILHKNGIIHRDIRVDNILITDQGVKVLDFGFSKSDEDSTLTSAEYALGNRLYSAPEQLLDSANATYQADIFSLGQCWYFSVTGNEHFEAEQLLLSGLPADVTNFYKRATNRNLDERFKIMKEMIAAYNELFPPIEKETFELDDVDLYGHMFLLSGGHTLRIARNTNTAHEQVLKEIGRAQERAANIILKHLSHLYSEG